jgi:hypothetical protein
LELARASGDGLGQTFKVTAKQIEDLIAGRAVQAFDSMAEAVGGAIAGQRSWGDAIKGTARAFAQFAAQFLREIAAMILKQIVLNALQNSGPAGWIAGLVNAAVKHEGGTVGGQPNRSRAVSPFVFKGAPRYHAGGIAGLRPGEIPAILQRNEEVLSTSDPRNVLNGGGKQGKAAGQAKGVRFVLVDDRANLGDYLQSSEGEETQLHFIRRNAMSIRSILGT